MTDDDAAPTVERGLDRRSIPQRSTSWATRAADLLERAGATPNAISVSSVVAALCAPLRLLLNMLDGMLAVEKGMHSPVGDLFNEVPDRLADLLFLASAGYATARVWLLGGTDLGILTGWIAGSAAVLTAYVRSLGAANGVGNYFDGPMAKPRRMWVLVVGCLASLLEPVVGLPRGLVLVVALAVVAIGSVVTVGIRLRLVALAMRAAS